MKAQALKGYRELSAPTLLGTARSHEPDSVPLFIDLAVFDDESVNERTQRVGGKVEGITPVVEAVNENLYAIICRKVSVARHLRSDDMLRV